MTSQLVIFRAFLFIFFRPPTLGMKKKSRKSTNKKNLALAQVPIVKRVNGVFIHNASHPFLLHYLCN